MSTAKTLMSLGFSVPSGSSLSLASFSEALVQSTSLTEKEILEFILEHLIEMGLEFSMEGDREGTRVHRCLGRHTCAYPPHKNI